jgi:signal transduction histidine kinase
MPENLAEQEHRQTPPTYWSYAMWAILGADEHPAGVMIQVTNATDAAAFRRQGTAMTEALLVSSVRQHELIDTIRRGEVDRHELEILMFQAQKLESLGVLAGGIAHDLNNMLTPVLGFAELASTALPENSPAAPMLEEIGKNARRAADLVQQILAYAGKGRFVIRSVDLSRLVREMGGLLGSAVSINTELRYDLAPELPFVEADATQLRQVVLNLVKNASEAVEEGGGAITVRTGLMQADHQTPPSSNPKTDLAGGPSVFLEVADSGCGITADVMEKIFDPFFTTKFTGRGLGLAVVQGIARGHGGALQVRSEPGRGSTFRLFLPCSTKAAAEPVVTRKSEDWRGAGTVLVIDDEEAIRDIAARILVMAGFTVLTAGDGQEGLRVFREEQGIDAVVLDLTMPWS